MDIKSDMAAACAGYKGPRKTCCGEIEITDEQIAAAGGMEKARNQASFGCLEGCDCDYAYSVFDTRNGKRVIKSFATTDPNAHTLGAHASDEV